MNTSKLPVSVLAFPSNLGLIEPAPGKEPGVNRLPEWLRKFGFYDLIEPDTEIDLKPPAYSMHLDPVSDMRNTASIAEYARKQSAVLRDVLSKKNNFAMVLGGDCSILIGNALALKQLGNFKLFFIDGHTDFMWPSLSSTHGVAGMDLAIVTGHGHKSLANIDDRMPYIFETDTWCVGNREYDVDYVNAIKSTSIHYYDLAAIRKSGVQPCVQSFFSALEADKPDGFWIHLDVDVLDPTIMPAVDSPDPDGLTYAELNEMLEALISHPLSTGMEITILDPDRDPDGRVVRTFISETGQTIKKSLSKKSKI